jgi:hypothetical protein
MRWLARARPDGYQPRERRPPCCFDPRHGPSVRSVPWAPPGGAPRPVPACAADAQRIEAGEDPHARMITLGGSQRPYWNAPAYYGPWAGGILRPLRRHGRWGHLPGSVGRLAAWRCARLRIGRRDGRGLRRRRWRRRLWRRRRWRGLLAARGLDTATPGGLGRGRRRQAHACLCRAPMWLVKAPAEKRRLAG